MDQALAAVIGAAIGSIGATGAAVAAGWSARCQAAIQASSQKDQWRLQMRRDVYGALLRATAEARDELGSLFMLLRDADAVKDPEWFASRLDEIKPLVNAVRLATATVFIEGPVPILDPVRRVEEGIVVFHTAMLGIVKNLSGPSGGSVAEYMAMCSRQRVGVRIALIDFASAARTAIDGEPGETVVASSALPLTIDSTQELSLLIKALAEQLSVPETQIDPSSTLSDQGADSIVIVNLAAVLRRHGLNLEMTWFFDHWQNSLHDIASLMSALRMKELEIDKAHQ